MTKTMAVAAPNDAEPVSESLTGHRNTFRQIVARYQSLRCSLACRAGGLGQSEDLAQETFVTAWRQLDNMAIRKNCARARQHPFLTGLFSVAAGCCLVAGATAETLYVDSNRGQDTNPGTVAQPLKTIEKAALVANAKAEPEPLTIKLVAGIYALPTAVIFQSQHAFAKEQRLTIEASVLPDDPNWNPGAMPVIFSVEDPRPAGQPGKHTETYAMKIKMSHVTVRGLKFLGNPLPNNWHSPLECLATNLTDVEVTQCLFAGDPDTLDIYSAVITDGHQFVVDHCIFTGCHACAVFWDGGRGVVGKANAMRYCIVDGAKISGVWTCDTDEDFEFHHNIVTRSEYFWLRKRGAPKTYRIHDSVVTGNKNYSGYGVETGATGPTGPEIRFDEERVVKAGNVALEQKRESKNYLHVVSGTPGSELGAGLFLLQ